MKVNYEIEYLDPNNEWQFIDVVFEGYPKLVSADFEYAGTHCTHGQSGTMRYPKYPSMEDSEITWDKSKYTESENNIIFNKVDKLRNKIEEAFCEKFADNVY